MRRRILTLIVMLTTFIGVNGQTDSLYEMSYDTFMRIVYDHHPLAVQARTVTLEGDFAIMNARGAFDPEALADVSQKYFQGDEYYSHIQGGFKIPTWLGITVDAGYEVHRGEYLNPEATTPGGGLWYAGASVTLGQGLFIDKRRAELRKAEIFDKSTEAEQALLLNDLLYEAGQAYWNWFEAFQATLIFEDALDLATQRFEAVIQGASLGDRPMVDTLEAGIQVQTRELALADARLKLKNAAALLSVYTWADGILPLEVDSTTIPVSPVIDLTTYGAEVLEFNNSIDLQNHPAILAMQFEMQSMAVDQRLNKEMLKPVVNLKYRALSENIQGDPLGQYSIADYNWGLEFKMPLFLRTERSRVKQTELEMRQLDLDISATAADLNFGIESSLNDLQTTFQQIQLFQVTVVDYQRLLDSERQLFDAGESSLFLVNSRELGYINAQLKLTELTAKNRKAALAAQYSTGTLNQIQ